MADWPDDAYRRAAFDIGVACLELLTNERRWIHRRVETIDVLRRELARRQVTVEFTVPPDLEDDLRIGEDGPWCVPIAVMRKKPLRQFDLRERGQPVPVLEKEQNGLIASELLVAAAIVALEFEPVVDAIQEALNRVATDPASEALGAVRELVSMSEEEEESNSNPAGTVLRDDTAGYFLTTLAENYILIALLDEPGGRRILKYSYDDQLDFQFGHEGRLSRLAQSLGWSPVLLDVPVPAALHGPSYHAEVVIPEELRLDAFIVDAENGQLLSTSFEEAVDRASLHAPDVAPDAEPVLIAGVYTERSGTPTVAAAISVVTATALSLGAALGNLGSTTAGSSSAVLLAGSALFAGIVARGGEHRLVRDVFLGARLMVVLVALSALAAAASIGFGASDCVRSSIWYSGAGVSWCAAVALSLAWIKAKPLQRRQDPSD